MKTIADQTTQETYMKKLDDHPAIKRYLDKTVTNNGMEFVTLF